MPQVVSQCDYLLGPRELDKEQTAYMLNDISGVFSRMGDAVPSDYIAECGKLLERLKVEELDALPVEPDKPAAAPVQAPSNAVPPPQQLQGIAPTQQMPVATRQPTDAENSTPVIEMVDIGEIKTSELFEHLFPRRQQGVIQLVDDMKQHGFDPAHAIPIWEEQNVPVDAHTRLQAAKIAGIKRVPVIRLKFASELDAIDYALAANEHRRENLSESEIFHLVKVRDQRMPRGGDHKSKDAKSKVAADAMKKSAERTARLIGRSASTVERIRTVLDSGNDAIIADVTSGKTSVSKAAAKIRAGKKTGKGSKASKKAKAKLGAMKKVAANLKADEGLLRSFNAELADQLLTVRNAVQDLIKHAKEEVKEAAKKEEAETEAKKSGKRGRCKAAESTTQGQEKP